MGIPLHKHSVAGPRQRSRAVEIAFSGKKSFSSARNLIGAKPSHLAVYRPAEYRPSAGKHKGDEKINASLARRALAGDPASTAPVEIGAKVGYQDATRMELRG
ncbi:hypothetical protein V5G24_14310 [Xanthobacter sp. VTT E-85241]|uniref:hypothetical protein n=1 Tax=Roseixanthobacter finlandensis TaxID=3119922 RepID=UPI00372C374D